MFAALDSFSQEIIKSEFAPSFNIYPGIIIRNYKNTAKSNMALIGSVHLAWQTNGKDKWHKFYNYPKIGIECAYTNFGNNKELGHGFGAVPVLQIKSRNVDRHWQMKFGMGVTYLTTPFDAVTNPNNLYFGGHFANLTIANITWGKLVGPKKYSLFYGVSTIHCSNGHNALPNAGANMILANIGFKFQPKEVKYFRVENIGDYHAGRKTTTKVYGWKEVEKDTAKIPQKLNYNFKFGLGTHEFGETTKATGGPLYPSYHGSLFIGKPYKNIHIVQAGLTYSYYTSFYDYIITQEVYPDKQKLRASTIVLFLGHEFVMGKISFSSQFGLYAYNPFFIKQKKIDGSWSQFGQKLEALNTNRLGLIYYPFKKHDSLNIVKNQLSLGIFIKANLGQADLFEYTVGFTF